MNSTIGSRFRRRVMGGDPGASPVFLGQDFVPSSEIGSVRSGRLGLRTYETKSDVAALAYFSRLRGDITFLSSYSESTQSLGSAGYSVDITDPISELGTRFWPRKPKLVPIPLPDGENETQCLNSFFF